MATGNMLQGQARGKVGDIVFSVVKGQQVSKVYNAKPANPKTDAQITQRVKLGAAVGFYKRNTQFFPFAFQKQAKESDYNAFVRENINISPYISRQGVVGNQIIPAPYQMTRGNLGSIEFNLWMNRDDEVTLIDSTFEVTNTEGCNGAALMQHLGARVGDMITLYVVGSSVDENGIAQAGLSRAWARKTFRTEDLEERVYNMMWDEDMSDGLILPELYQPGIAPMPENKYYFGAKVTLPILTATNVDNPFGYVLVLSRKVTGGKLEVSSASMKLSDQAIDTYKRYRSAAMLQEAKNSYGVKDDAFLAPSMPNVPQP